MKALDNAKAIYDLTMNERCEEKVQVLFSNGLHKLMIDLIEELEELENRSCSNCKYVYIDTLGFNYCENPISPLSSCIFALHPSFCCNKWENKQ